MNRAFLLCTALALPLAATASGDLDERFDGDGVKVVNLSGNFAFDGLSAGLIDGQGRIVAAGHRLTPTRAAFVMRLGPGGVPDAGFGDGGYVLTAAPAGYDNLQWAALVQRPNGSLLAAGFARNIGQNTDIGYLCQFLPSGSPDASFGGIDGCRTATFSPGSDNDTIVDIALQPDGRVVAVGKTDADADPQADDFVARFEENGLFDTCLGAPACNGTGRLVEPAAAVLSSFEPRAVALGPDGRILVAGNASGGGNADMAVFRLTSNGTLDDTFAGDGSVLVAFNEGGLDFDRANDVLVDALGRIVLVGEVTTDFGRLAAATRMFSNGTPDVGYGTGSRRVFFFNDVSPTQAATAAALDAAGRLVATGYAAGENTSIGDCGVARLDNFGNLDGVFAFGGYRGIDANFGEEPAVLDECNHVAVAGRSIVLFGSAGPDGVTRDSMLVKLDQDDVLRDGFED